MRIARHRTADGFTLKRKSFFALALSNGIRDRINPRKRVPQAESIKTQVF